MSNVLDYHRPARRKRVRGWTTFTKSVVAFGVGVLLALVAYVAYRDHRDGLYPYDPDTIYAGEKRSFRQP